MFNNDNIKEIDIIEFGEFILSIIHEYVQNNIKLMSNQKYISIIRETVLEIINGCYGNILPYNELFDIIDKNITYYFNNVGVLRSHQTSIILKKHTELEHNKIEKQLRYLKNKPQPSQKHDDWYYFRWNLITASSCYKALSESQCKQNELILSKCTPIDINKKKRVNVQSPFHWGHKYEPLSVLFYEKLYNTVIGEFGCIKHDTEDNIGASADGINIKPGNPRYGRLLEIKNIVNRTIDGIPSEPYWCQMQLQMECTNLDECDFLETRFKEYSSEDDFNNDGNFNFTKEGKTKGIIVCFYSEGKPIYKYSPFQCNKEKYIEWYDKLLEETKMTWVRNIYWWLDEHSCILVERNKKWFTRASLDFKRIWEIILKERKEGFEHRKPKKRKKKTKNNIIIKIRTESFDICDTNLQKIIDANIKNAIY